MRIVYSPLDAVRIARENPTRQVVFFAVGFETTAPATALAARQARRMGLTNFSLLVSHVLVPPAMEAILSSPGNRVQGFLAAGHVCTVMGYEEYLALAERYRVPIVVTGFEPVDLLEGILGTLRQLEEGRCEVENQYARAVQRGGNREAQEVVAEVYEVCDRPWRGLGVIPRSGLRLRRPTATWMRRSASPWPGFGPSNRPIAGAEKCCKAACVPTSARPSARAARRKRPLGAPMVSSEGACAAYWKYGRR